MTQFQYTVHAVDNGEVFTSTCYADDEDHVRSGLKQMGYTVDAIKQQKNTQILGPHKRIKLADLVNMYRRFSVMYSSGLPLLECLSSLVQENESKKLSDILQDIHDEIERGSNVGDAFSRHPAIFSQFFVNMLRAGETAGKFDYVLAQLSAYMEKEYDLSRKIRQALTYPLVVVIMIVLVVTTIMIVVVPVFSKVYTKLGVPLPGPTITLIYISKNAIYIFPSLIAVVIVWWIAHKRIRVLPIVRERLDKWKLSMPVIGPVYNNVILLKFIRTLSIMINAGLPISKSLAIAEGVADNIVASEATSMIQRNIKRGGTVTEAVKLHSFFPQTIVHAFSTGEEAGKIGEMLDKFASGVEQEVDDGIKKLILKIEPTLMVIMSLIVGFILLAIYLPIFDLMNAIHQ
jgi:type IV pilus assembly protein PilC